MMPKVSVILPVYNGKEYLAEAIQSVLDQDFTDFELIIIDDGSTDGSPQAAAAFKDGRIRFFRQENAGLAATLNRGIALAAGEYIARQDQDDISMPSRFGTQVRYLDASPGCALAGSWAEIRSGAAPSDRAHLHPAESYILKFELLLDNPFVHSTVMLRKKALEKCGGYTTDPARQPPEDYELWSRLAREYELANIPDVLLTYREFPGSMSRAGAAPFREKVAAISAENIAWYLGADAPAAQIRDLSLLYHGITAGVGDRPDFRKMKAGLYSAAGKIARGPEQAEELRRRADIVMLRAEKVYGRRGPVWGLLRSLKTWVKNYPAKDRT